MTAPADSRTRAEWRSRSWIGIVGLLVVLRLPVLCLDTGSRVGRTSEAVQRALTEPAVRRIERAIGVSPTLAAAIRAAVPEHGRLVLYSPYGGAAFELDAGDPRGEPARQVRTLFERVKNLLYPRPRDVAFARDADELRAKIAPTSPGRLVVLDGTQGPEPLTVGGDYELLHREALGGGQMRLWRLRGTK
ncbi:MAG: hypothetical protein KDC98_19240 [Planctomycetes bacterium]|nr:hypothetical protein [Planctomycetota bacterium]